eukprot:s3436_g15.t1
MRLHGVPLQLQGALIQEEEEPPPRRFEKVLMGHDESVQGERCPHSAVLDEILTFRFTSPVIFKRQEAPDCLCR